MPKGFTLKELVFLFFVLTIGIVIAVPKFFAARERSRQAKCKANLKQFRNSMQIYTWTFCGTASYSRTKYPKRDGAGFLTVLYQELVLITPNSYLCPSTNDSNKNIDLGKIIHSDKDNENYVSYAARAHATEKKYRWLKFIRSNTVIASDDKQGEPNHQNGDLMFFLFRDGSVEYTRSKDANWNNYFDPLTN